MKNIEFSDSQLKEARLYYSEEKIRLEGKLDYVVGMIVKLGGSVRVPSINSSTVTAKGLKPKKRGPKSIWGEFILKRLGGNLSVLYSLLGTPYFPNVHPPPLDILPDLVLLYIAHLNSKL